MTRFPGQTASRPIKTEYLFGDRSVRSDIQLSELPRSDRPCNAPAVSVEMAPSAFPDWTAQDWAYDWCDDNESVNLTLVRWGSDLRLDFPNLCEFILQHGQSRILVHPLRDLDASTLEHLLVDQVLPRYFAHDGTLMVHASAVAVGEQSVLFLGKSGWGKSTLAGVLDAQGHSVLSDDCVMVSLQDGWVQAQATYASLRMYDDSLMEAFGQMPQTSAVAAHSVKRRLQLPKRHSNEARPVKAVYLLNDPAKAVNHVQIENCSAVDLCMGLIRNSFQLDVTDTHRTRQLLAQASAVATSLPAFHLRYPRHFSQASQTAKTISCHAAQLPEQHLGL